MSGSFYLRAWLRATSRACANESVPSPVSSLAVFEVRLINVPYEWRTYHPPNFVAPPSGRGMRHFSSMLNPTQGRVWPPGVKIGAKPKPPPCPPPDRAHDAAAEKPIHS